jgi:histidinol-phosphate/aromatic aminotransferase/cobyric acid decarboxylase-like protein
MKRYPWYLNYYEDLDGLLNLSNNVCYDPMLIDQLQINNQGIFQYPDASTLYTILSNYCNVDVKNLAIGFGAGDILYRLFQYLRNYSIGILTPTYELSQTFAENLGLNFVSSDILSQLNTDVLYIANPNGITGQVLLRKDIIKLTKKYKYVIVDEAYGDFCKLDFSVLSDAISNENLIVIKTLSKSAAAPGLRFGWCISNISIINDLQDLRSSTVVTGISVQVVPFLLSSIAKHVERMLITKKYVEEKYDCIPSHGNFVLFRNDPKLKCKIKKTCQQYYRMALTDIDTFMRIENESVAT